MSGRQPFRDMRPGEGLDGFHQRCVVPTREETTKRNADIDQFVRFLHAEFSYESNTAAEVVKSGSLGKGTAVRGSADIDLVVFFNGLSSIQDLKASRRRLLYKLEGKVKSYGPWRGRIEQDNRTTFSLSYILDGQEIDVLPACDILNTVSPDRIYSSMTSYPGGKLEAAQQYSTSLAPLQIEFVKPVCEGVKRVIRLVKFWKKERGLDIRSYTLELITIHADRSRSGSVSTLPLFRDVLCLLQDCGSLRITFDDNYNSRDFTRTLAAPYVLDPANPYMNTLYGVNTAQVSREARSTLACL